MSAVNVRSFLRAGHWEMTMDASRWLDIDDASCMAKCHAANLAGWCLFLREMGVPKMWILKMGHRAKLRCHTPCYHALMPPEMWPVGAPVYPGCLGEMFESLLFFVQFQLKVVYPKGWGSYENWWRWSPWLYLWVTSIAPPSRALLISKAGETSGSF